MRQLDLFNSLFANTTEKTESGDEKEVAKDEEEVSVKANIEIVETTAKLNDTAFSLVELAEAELGSTVSPIPDDAAQADTPNVSPGPVKEPFEQVFEDKAFFEQEEQPDETAAGNISDENSTVVDSKEVQAVRIAELEQNAFARNGAVVFDDGKISVKVKAKAVVAPPLEVEPPPSAVVVPATAVFPGSTAETLPAPAEASPSSEEINDKESVEKSKKEPQKRGRKPIKEIEAEADLIEVPDDDILFQKQYYAISEVAKWFRVNTSLLRFWENEFDILKPRKNRKGDRLFRPEDVKSLQLIYQLLRQRKYTIEGAKEYIKSNRKKADLELQLTNSLQKFKSFLLDLKANLD